MQILIENIFFDIAYRILFVIKNKILKVLYYKYGYKWKFNQIKLEIDGKLKKDSLIRISFAYLFRIKINNKYFLVFNNRTKKFQPVGGAYKFYKNEEIYLNENLAVKSDDFIPLNQKTERDYRLLVKNKDLSKFIKRFNSTNERETVKDLSREFIEEIFQTKILNREQFSELSYTYCGRHIAEMTKDKYEHYELLFADIINLRLNKKQEQLFKSLENKSSDKYIFATANQIKNYGIVHATDSLDDNIANHTYKILSENIDELVLKDKYRDIITIEI